MVLSLHESYIVFIVLKFSLKARGTYVPGNDPEYITGIITPFYPAYTVASASNKVVVKS